MRKVIVNEFISLDGVMQAPGGADEDRSGGFSHGGWQIPYFDDVFARVAAEGMADTDRYLFGRRTYEIMASFWPTQPDHDMFAASLNGLPKYVASTTLSEPLEWRNSTIHDRFALSLCGTYVTCFRSAVAVAYCGRPVGR